MTPDICAVSKQLDAYWAAALLTVFINLSVPFHD
jgi:hypothetical protein